MNTDLFLYWVHERWKILQARRAGAPKPWTEDMIMQNYRFCNVHREDDAVTEWIHAHWLRPHTLRGHLVFNTAVARIFNQPETLAAIGYITNHGQVQKIVPTLKQRAAAGKKVFNAAYIVSTNGRAINKIEYVVTDILAPLWRGSSIFWRAADSLAHLHEELNQYNGLGSFMAAQVVADVKHAPEYADAPDWWTFAASGPGSRRGLNRIMGLPVRAPCKEPKWKAQLLELEAAVAPSVARWGIPKLDLQNLQNCLCEYDKYVRAKTGEGRPKQKFNGAA